MKGSRYPDRSIHPSGYQAHTNLLEVRICLNNSTFTSHKEYFPQVNICASKYRIYVFTDTVFTIYPYPHFSDFLNKINYAPLKKSKMKAFNVLCDVAMEHDSGVTRHGERNCITMPLPPMCIYKHLYTSILIYMKPLYRRGPVVKAVSLVALKTRVRFPTWVKCVKQAQVWRSPQVIVL